LKNSNVLNLLLFSILSLSCGQAQNGKQEKNGTVIAKAYSGVFVYRFGKKYLDISKLKFLDSLPASKLIVIDSLRFDTNTAVYKGRKYKLMENGDIVITANHKYLKTIPNQSSFDNRNYSSVIFSVPDGIIHVLCLSNGYHARKYDEEGTLLHEWVLKDNPFLNYFTATNNEILFSGIYSDNSTTIEMNTVNGLQKRTNVATAGIITDEATDTLAGTIYVTKDQKHVMVDVKNKKWQIDSSYFEDGFETVLKDSILIIAQYPMISCGCSVNAYNVNTGNVIWMGDLKQISVAQSKYLNKVYVTLFHGRVIVEGIESAGTYLQVLDFKTGKRLFDAMPKYE
jgi:hypothetical protein